MKYKLTIIEQFFIVMTVEAESYALAETFWKKNEAEAIYSVLGNAERLTEKKYRLMKIEEVE